MSQTPLIACTPWQCFSRYRLLQPRPPLQSAHLDRPCLRVPTISIPTSNLHPYRRHIPNLVHARHTPRRFRHPREHSHRPALRAGGRMVRIRRGSPTQTAALAPCSRASRGEPWPARRAQDGGLFVAYERPLRLQLGVLFLSLACTHFNVAYSSVLDRKAHARHVSRAPCTHRPLRPILRERTQLRPPARCPSGTLDLR